MPEITITEASARLGVSPDTIRRRIASGELPARKEKNKYLVELPEGLAPAQDPPVATAPAAPSMAIVQGDDPGDLRRTISILEDQLAARTREIHELHILLQQAQTAALPAGQRQDMRPPWWKRLLKLH